MAENARIIVIALGRGADDKLINALVGKNICNIVLSKDKEIAQKEIEKCLSDEGRKKDEIISQSSSPFAQEQKNLIVPNVPSKMTSAIKKDLPIIGKSMITIGVCGVEPHVGTTHHALALTSYLIKQQCKACYLESNIHGDI